MHLLMIKSRKTNTPPTCLYESPHFHSQYDQEIKAFAALANIKLNVYFKIQILFYVHFCSCPIRYNSLEKIVKGVPKRKIETQNSQYAVKFKKFSLLENNSLN